MRDVGSQLAEYFEAATEHIDAEDVVAHVRATEQSQRLVPRRLRPAGATVAGFVGVILLVGGALLAGVLLHDPSVVEPQPLGTPVAETGGGWGWWLLAVAGAAAVVGVIVLASPRLRRATKEVEMQRLAEQQQEATQTRAPRRSRRAWLIGLAILVVLAGAIAMWAIIEAGEGNDADLAVVNEFADTWDAAVLASDGETAATLFTADGVFGDWAGRDSIDAVIDTWGQYYTEMSHGAPTKVDNGVYAYPVTAVYVGQDWAGEMTVTLEGDLVSSAQLDWGPVG